MKDNCNYFKKKYKKFKKLVKKMGFTLIELLAVIIILGILLIIAIPSVTEYIQSTRKESYVAIAKKYIDGERNIVNSNKMELYDKTVTYYVPNTCISLEKGGDSPYGKFDPAYVVVTYDGDNYDYYFTGRDTANMGIYLTYEYLLNVDSVKSGIKSIDTTIGVGDRENILRLTDSCKLEDAESYLATMNIPDKGKYGDKYIKPDKLYSIIVEQNKENGQMILDNQASTYVSSSTGIAFNAFVSDKNGKGVYVRAGTENDLYPIYYYRGAVTNNNVIFAGFCWKIVRTTETGGIKLIYNGTHSNGTCNNTGVKSQIGTSYFNNNSNYNAYVGYMYGTPNSTNYDDEHISTKESTSSTIKTYIDTWYSNNLIRYTKYLEDTIWCSDRSFASNNKGTGAGVSSTNYSSNEHLRSDFPPNLSCINQNDRFTVNKTMEGRDNGNGALTYPVALLTSDELKLTGNPSNNVSNYLLTGEIYWTMSPNSFYGQWAYRTVVASSDWNWYSNISAGVRPVISLQHTAKISGDGDGSANNPYFVDCGEKTITIEGNNDITTDKYKVYPGTTVTLLSITGDNIIHSFKMNGQTITGVSFTMPERNVIISDINVTTKGNITIEGNSDITSNLTKAFSGTKIFLSSISKNTPIKTFKMNGELINGYSFIMPEGNVTITDISFYSEGEYIIFESEHNPYPNSLNDVIYGEKTFEGATSLTVFLDYQTESTSYDWVYLYDSQTSTKPVNNKKYGGSKRNFDTITINNNYVKIIFRTDGSVNNYYGFKAIVIPNYE